MYQPFEQEPGGGRLFVHARGDPYALVPTITKIVREMAQDIRSSGRRRSTMCAPR